jgi:hypothetical protein
LLSVSLFAQVNGRIMGTITDQTGAVIGGAKVTIIDSQRGVARNLTTDQAGEYNAPTLIPGTYTVRVEASGFKVLDRQNILVEVGKEVRVDLTPQPGEQTQTVTINEAVPLVDAASATLGGTLANSEINDMPLNGRNYQNLLGLRPGTMIQPGGSPWTQSTNGIRPDETVWMVDGIINVNFHDYRPLANSPSPFTDGATILPIDAIQEFNIEENPKAEFGWKPGATVNVGIKSGTNSYHGSAYAYGRYDAWAARNFFNPAPNEKLPTSLKQFGGVVGGPIKKDKLFFFGGYEGLRSFVGNALASNVPALGGLGGDPANSMVDAIAALQAKGVTVNPVSLKLFGCPPTGGNCTGGLIQGASLTSTTYVSSFPNVNTSDNGIGKMDYNINSKHRLNGMVFISNYLANGEDHGITASYWQNSNPLKAYTISGDWTYVPSSSVVNEFRMGYNHVNFALAPDDASLFANGTSYPLNTGVTTTGGFPNVEITGFAGQVLGSWRGRPTQFITHFYDFQDALSYLKGKHAFKFGGEFAPIKDFFNNHDTRGRVQFRGNHAFPGSTPLEDFMAGDPGRAFVLVGTAPRNYSFSSIAGYVQDDWRVAPRIMVNLGLGYSYVTPWKEDNNLLGNFDPTLGMVQQGQPSVGDTIWKPDRKNFSPRVGFAWDVTGRGTTVVRGGASLIYSMFNPAQFSNSPNNFGGGNVAATPTGACTTAPPVGTPCPQTFGGTISLGTATLGASNLNWSSTTPTFPTGAAFSCTASAHCSLLAVDPNLKSPYAVNYTLGVQHAFTGNFSLDVAYVGTHGDRLYNWVSLNGQPPSAAGDLPAPYAAKFPYLQYIDQSRNNGYSNYNSLQTTLTKRVSHGLSFTTGYTYGHGLDNGSLNRFGNLPQNSLRPDLEYANGDSDIRHRVTITTSYAIPGKKGFGQLLEGWKLNSIINMQGGQPYYVNDTGNNFSGTGDLADRWNFYGNPGDFTSGSSSIPTCQGFGVTPSGGVDTSGVTCTVTSGVSGITSKLPSSLAAQCAAVAPDPTTLAAGGCFVKGKSVMTPPKAGTFGTMGRNIFRDQGFKNVDFSVFKNFAYKERYNAQFRVEFFNVFNHPTVANPYGSAAGFGGGTDPSAPTTFGCGCQTPDVGAGNPLVGSGSNRVMQLGLKLTF